MNVTLHPLRGEKPVARYAFCDTPVGRCLAADTDLGVCWLSFVDRSDEEALAELKAFWGDDKLILDIDHIKLLIDSVFTKESSKNKSIRVLVSGTPFQLNQWKTLTMLNAGETITYGKLAERSGYPRAIRAAGTAIGRNNVSFLIPCHRVVRADGSIGGYRWGAEVKRRLLAWERG